MLNWLPLNRYQIRQIKGYSTIAAISLVSILVLGNILTAVIRDSVEVDDKSYYIKDGFPIFTSPKDYISLVKSYPYDPGVKLTTHIVVNGESLWDIAHRYKISIDTIISANPFLKSLAAQDGEELVIPAEDGALLAFNDIFDVRRMRKLLKFKGTVRGKYLPNPFTLISTDDIRLVFFKCARPCIVNNNIESIYKLKNIFQTPLTGNFSSLYGDRVHPFLHGMHRYHNGVDIIAPTRTPIRPAKEGMVIYTGWRDGYGKTVMVQHEDGYTTLYGHCFHIYVKRGDWVTKDDVIALVGSTGLSTGPHLHFTIMQHGADINPLYFIW